MMLVAGIDIGSATTKVVILTDHSILATSIIPTGPDSAATATQAMNLALEKNRLSWRDIGFIVATGYGRIIVPFSHAVITEISCHAKGAHFLFPAARTILDMGGQDCKAIRVDERGIQSNFAMNDKCAAGTGRFLEAMARTLNLSLEELGPLSLKAQQEVEISNMCAVFAKSEVSYLVRQGLPKEDILAGLHKAISERVHALLKRVGIEPEFVITGGIAKNIAVVHNLEKRIGLTAKIPPEPQLVGALGAALFASDRAKSD
jgi:predicted CoA-substrate-specific enzyme activase